MPVLSKKVRDIKISRGQRVAGLLRKMGAGGGFSAKNLATAAEILGDMLADEKCVRFLSFPAALVATGVRGVLSELVRRKMFDIIITTCGTLDHDLARGWGGRYWHGSFDMDDAKLRREGINRLGNVLVPDSSYGLLIEKKMRPVLRELLKEKAEWRPSELIREFGDRMKDKNSILYWAARNNIKVFCPGIVDGAFGTQLTIFASQNPRFKMNELADQQDIASLAFKMKKSGALIIGGGISKHHTLWWNQFKGGLNYAVYITTAPEYDGSLSGARLREAVSWGKVNPKARHVTVEGDASVLLPILAAAII